MSKKNKRENSVVYSTNPNFEYEDTSEQEQETLEPKEQKLYVLLDRKLRAGKELTIIQGFVGTSDDLKELAKELKSKCGVGGSVKEGDILVQGNFRDKLMELLKNKGYQVVRKGG